MRRESYSNRFATALDGVDIENPGTALDRSGHPNPVPRVVGPVARRAPVQVRDVQFLRAHTSRTVKMTVPGPFTMSQQAQDDYYGAPDEVGMAYAEAVRGRDPRPVRGRGGRGPGRRALHAGPPRGRTRLRPRRPAPRHRRPPGTSAVHICFGYAAIIHERPSGYSFLPELAATECDQSASRPRSRASTSTSSTRSRPRRSSSACSTSRPTRRDAGHGRRSHPARVPARRPGRLIAAPDCGMKYLSRDAAYGKLEALVEGARIAAAA